MSVIHTQGKPTAEFRLMAFPIVCGIFLLVLFFRLWYFQVVLGPTLSERAALSNRNHPSVMAPRGRIFDREGQLIAGVRQELVVTAVPKFIHDHPDVFPRLAALLGTTEKQLYRKLGKSKTSMLPVPVFVGVPVETGTKILEERDALPGIDVQTEPMRYDANTTDFTHVLGYVAVPSAGDNSRLEKEDIKPAQYVGKSGVEWFYEKLLMGEPGTQVVEIDSKRRPVRIVGGDSPIPGSQITLAVDDQLQQIARSELVYPMDFKDPDLRGKPRPGAVVAIDPATGEILCMYSSPSFDLKQMESPINAEDYESISVNPDKPFQNRAVDSPQAPGSIYKIVTSVAMQQAGILDLNRTVKCDGAFHFGLGNKLKIKCLEHHGDVSYTRALAESCNTYFCTMGVQVGPVALAKAARELGLGETPPIDLRTQTNHSVVPDPDYKLNRKLGHWYEGDTANTAIGQGYVAVTPLQMADLAAMVANRGTMYRPHLVNSVRAPGEKEAQIVQPDVYHKIDMPASFWDVLINAMKEVFTDKHGTATNCRIQGLDWAGKTGSAENKRDDKTHSWFIGFAPADNPKIAVAVIVEKAGHGAYIAGPLARDIVKAYLFPKAAVASAKTRSNSASEASSSSVGIPATR